MRMATAITTTFFINKITDLDINIRGLSATITIT